MIPLTSSKKYLRMFNWLMEKWDGLIDACNVEFNCSRKCLEWKVPLNVNYCFECKGV